MATVVDSDLRVRGAFTADAMTYPNNSISDADISSFADIAASKCQQQYQPCGAQPNTAATDETRVVHVAQGNTGAVLEFRAGSIAKAVGDALVTLDLKKNGASILDTVITLDSSNTDRVAVAGVVDTAELAAGDVLEVVIDATIGTGTLPTGVFWAAKIREDAD